MEDEYSKLVKEQAAPPSPTPALKMVLQRGMVFTFHGYAYKVMKILKKGRLVIKLVGETK